MHLVSELRHQDALDRSLSRGTGLRPSSAEVYASAAAFYVVLLKNRYFDEAQDFAEWFLDEFDLDLET